MILLINIYVKNKATLVRWIILFLLLLPSPFVCQEHANKSKFIIIGDTQHIGFWESLYWDYWNEHNEDKTKLLFKEIATRNPSFILHLGDITKDGSSKRAWKDFETDSKPVKQKGITFYPIYGNHEYFGSDSDLYSNFNKHFPNVANKKWYSFIHNEIGFVLINSNFGDLSAKDTTEQRSWYLDQLSKMENNDSIKVIIVASHHPPFTNSKIVSPNKIVERDYAKPFINSSKSKLFFSGHCHSYERFVKNGKIFIVSGGGGGPRQKLNIDKETREFDDQFNGPSIRFFHFVEIETDKDSLLLRVIKLNNNKTFKEVEKLSIPKL